MLAVALSPRALGAQYQRELSFFLAKTLPARPELCCGCWVFGPCVIACSVFGVCGGFWGVKNCSERGVSLCPLGSRRDLGLGVV